MPKEDDYSKRCASCFELPKHYLLQVCGDCHARARGAGKSQDATGPCVGCGERNHTAHNVSICAACTEATRHRRGRAQVMTKDGLKWVDLGTAPGAASDSFGICQIPTCHRNALWCIDHGQGPAPGPAQSAGKSDEDLDADAAKALHRGQVICARGLPGGEVVLVMRSADAAFAMEMVIKRRCSMDVGSKHV